MFFLLLSFLFSKVLVFQEVPPMIGVGNDREEASSHMSFLKSFDFANSRLPWQNFGGIQYLHEGGYTVCLHNGYRSCLFGRWEGATIKTALEMLLGEYRKIFTPDHKIQPKIGKHLPKSLGKKVRFADDPPASSLPKAPLPQTIYTALDSSPFLPKTAHFSQEELLFLLVSAWQQQVTLQRSLIKPFFIITIEGFGAINEIGQFLTLIFAKNISPEALGHKAYPILTEIFAGRTEFDSQGYNPVFLI